MKLNFFLENGARVPEFKHNGDAGMDIRALVNTTIPASSVALVHTGVHPVIPEGYWVEVAGRSGLARSGIVGVRGIIDQEYTGEIGVIIHNTTKADFHISAGDRIAQLIVHKLHRVEVGVVDNLPSTSRGAAGFGSTGVK